jgi:hypothetical protein
VCIRRIPQLRPGTSARPLFGRDVTQGGENQAQADYGSAITPEFRPTRDEISRRNLAARLRDYRGRVPASGSRVRPRRTWPGLGEVAAGRSRGRRGSGNGGRRPAINCQKFTALCIFKPSRRASLIRPGKTRQPSRGKRMRDFGTIVRCRGRSSGWLARPRGKPAGRNRARVSCTAGSAVAGRPAGRWN